MEECTPSLPAPLLPPPRHWGSVENHPGELKKQEEKTNNQQQGLGITMNIMPQQIATPYCAYYAAAFWDISLVPCNHFVSWFSWFNLFAMLSCSPPGLNLLTVHVCLINNALFPLTHDYE